MAEFSAIVLIITGILQFILFFKIWGMTNDVKKLKKRFNPSIVDDIRIAYLNGQKELAQEILNRNYTLFSERLKKIDEGWEGLEKNEITSFLNKIEKVAERYNLLLPSKKG